MAMPTSALACTQIYMGSKLTADGNTYYGRSEDFGPRYVKHFGIEPAHKDGNEYTSVESGFEYKSKGATYRYTFVRDNPLSGKIATTHIPRLASTRRAFPALPR
ncbi:MAG: C69 family dipeptidase [Collinsella sp.]